jgi:hypothetical protein
MSPLRAEESEGQVGQISVLPVPDPVLHPWVSPMTEGGGGRGSHPGESIRTWGRPGGAGVQDSGPKPQLGVHPWRPGLPSMFGVVCNPVIVPERDEVRTAVDGDGRTNPAPGRGKRRHNEIERHDRGE